MVAGERAQLDRDDEEHNTRDTGEKKQTKT